jgi:hypothetical protein
LVVVVLHLDLDLLEILLDLHEQNLEEVSFRHIRP